MANGTDAGVAIAPVPEAEAEDRAGFEWVKLGPSLESVLIPNEERGYTQCVSSQIGCALT